MKVAPLFPANRAVLHSSSLKISFTISCHIRVVKIILTNLQYVQPYHEAQSWAFGIVLMLKFIYIDQYLSILRNLYGVPIGSIADQQYRADGNIFLMVSVHYTSALG